MAKSLVVYDPLRGFYINETVWNSFLKFNVIGSTEIDLFGIVHVKVEFIPILKIYTIPILGGFQVQILYNVQIGPLGIADISIKLNNNWKIKNTTHLKCFDSHQQTIAINRNLSGKIVFRKTNVLFVLVTQKCFTKKYFSSLFLSYYHLENSPQFHFLSLICLFT